MSKEFVWQSVSWRRGDEQYGFDIERGGLFATMKAPGGRSMTLPMVVWEGLLDALKATKETKARSEQRFPVRAKARWYEGETTELVESFRAGRSIPELAKAHHRSEYAIEHQLDRMGLISNAETYGPRSESVRTPGNEPAGAHPLDAPFSGTEIHSSPASPSPRS